LHAFSPRAPGSAAPSSGGSLTAAWSSDLDEFGVPGSHVSGASDIAAVPRAPGVVDLVITDSQHQVQVYENFGSVDGWVSMPLPPPSGQQLLAVAATSDNGTLEIIAATTNGVHQLYYTHSTTAGAWPLAFTDWAQVPAAAPFGNAGQLALTSWGDGTIDAFWITTYGNIGHANGTHELSSVESGDSEGLTYLEPLLPSTSLSLDAVAWSWGRLDLVTGNVSSAGRGALLQHHYFDANGDGWGPASNGHRETRLLAKVDGDGSFSFEPMDFALLSAAPNGFEILAVDSAGARLTPTLYHSSYGGTFGWKTADDRDQAPILFDAVNMSLEPLPGAITGAFWAGNRGVFGATGSSVWQMMY